MILFKNADLYTPEHIGKRDVLTCYDKIVEIGESLSPNISGLKIVELDGKKMLPGFIDQHVHIVGGGGEAGLHSRTSEFNVSSAVKSGVTTIVGLLGTDGITRTQQALIAKTKALNNEGITCRCLAGSYGYPPATLTDSILNDIVFIDEVIGCKLALGDHRGPHPTRDEIIRLASDIRVAGLVSGKAGVLHLHMGADAAGMDLLIDIAKTTDIPVTLFRPTHLSRHLEKSIEFMKLGGYADYTAKETLAQMLVQIIGQADNELITVSSDSNGSMPKFNQDRTAIIGMGIGQMTWLYETIRKLVTEHGQPLERVLPYITSNVAKALMMPQKGSIAVGNDADLVVVDENYEIVNVVARGKVAMENKVVLIKGMFEE